MKQVPCTTCDDQQRQTIGNKGDTVDVYAFRGGAGIDSAFQLGVSHAHIAAELPIPSLIVGVSLGAVHAAATAEILRAPAQLSDPDKADAKIRRGAQLNRFREILSAYQDFATNLPGSLPDLFEADAGRPLLPNPQAIHFGNERESRLRELRARSGIIALFNDVFRQTITIQTATRLIRAYLGFRAISELPRGRFQARLREGWRLGTAFARAPWQCTRVGLSLLHAYVGGTARVAHDAISSWHHSWFRDWLINRLHKLEGRHGEGYTAGDIIFDPKRPRIAPQLAWFLGLLFTGGVVTLAAITLLIARMPLFFLLCILPAAAALIACAVYDVRDELPKLVSVLRNTSAVESILAYYDLLRDIGNDYLVEDLLIRLFDPAYHGKIDMTNVAKRAMQGSDEPHPETKGHSPRRFTEYSEGGEPIHVVPFVADLQTGQLQQISETSKIVDGLRAAVATVPFLSPAFDQETGKVLVDAANIADDATSPAIDVLRKRLHPEVGDVRVFAVSPITTREAERPPAFTGLVEAAQSALELSRFRDSEVDAEIVDLYNHLLPRRSRAPERLQPGQERALCCFGNDADGNPLHFVRSVISNVQPEYALHTSGKFLEARAKVQRREVIARAVAEGCRATLTARLGEKHGGCRAILNRNDIPGAIEVCSHCDLAKQAMKDVAQAHARVEPVAPLSNPEPPKNSRPTVNLLFSGGVFRGVFQIGVLNALNELEVRPNLIAGSSVGSIVAAMIAHVFTTAERPRQIARLAATFLTLDKLIITDRFADFVRRFTLRAAATKFSLRDADLFFRNYDAEMAEFGAVARRVVGGIEHLFYINPYKLSELVQNVRHADYAAVYRNAQTYAQDLCDRGLVGAELLGAEPLALLIRQHVMGARDRDFAAHSVPLSTLERQGLTFLLTATNLTQRALSVLGLHESSDVRRAALLEALLASSAFPGAFRPRWSREIFFDENTTDQYIDGGVLDNLPVSHVVRHLYNAAMRAEIAFRPEGNRPHLVLTASLEPDTPPVSEPNVIARLGRSWVAARRRAKLLRYNKKIERFAKVQSDLRYIWNQYASVPARPIGLDTLDIEVLVVKPKWLCGTFAFHPMVGFRRDRQAASIAHGCAATFATVKRIVLSQTTTDPSWLPEWGMKETEEILPGAATLVPLTRMDGTCHFRQSALCPFSPKALDSIPNDDLDPEVKNGLAKIYFRCGEPSTHLPS